jgi:hypothetical protein
MKLDELRARLRTGPKPTAKPKPKRSKPVKRTGPATEMREADAPCATCGERYHTDLDLPVCYSCRLEDFLRSRRFGIVMKVPK